jgi:uncharacterized small protein (DUF1192 family)
MEEDDRPRPLAPSAKRWIEPIPLDPISVADLQEYIAALRTEITRAERAIDGKQSHRSQAEAFFRK